MHNVKAFEQLNTGCLVSGVIDKNIFKTKKKKSKFKVCSDIIRENEYSFYEITSVEEVEKYKKVSHILNCLF